MNHLVNGVVFGKWSGNVENAWLAECPMGGTDKLHDNRSSSTLR